MGDTESPEGAYGNCQAPHTMVLPKIMFEVRISGCSSVAPLEQRWRQIWFNTNAFASRWDEAANKTQPFVYSTGDDTGYSLHGDQLYGWQGETLKVRSRLALLPLGTALC
jgi:hypothetical protein